MVRTIWISLLLFVCFSFDDTLSQTDSTDKLSNAANCFNINLYKQLVIGQANVVCSPYGTDVLLSMLLVGAGGLTFGELNKTLGYAFPLFYITDMEDAFEIDLGSQTSSDGNILSISNSLWIQTGNTLLSEYHDIVTQDFYATEQNLDFAGNPDGSTNTINDWVKNQTRGLIPKLFDEPLDATTFLVLVNTIYFKAAWEYPFEIASTQNDTFFNNGNRDEPVLVPFMNQKNTFKYKNYSTLMAEVLEMDYKGGNTSMVLLLPYESSSLDELEQALECTSFQSGFQTSLTRVSVSLPRFTVKSSFNLTTALKQLGIITLFRDDADLSGIAPGTYVSEIIQKAVIKVNENGTEAAAATAAVVITTTAVLSLLSFKVDRPFIYIIRHIPTNINLFIGRVNTFSK